MRIVLTGGGTGGHFYPLIAVAEALEDIAAEKNLIEPEVYYIGPDPFDRSSLHDHDILFMPSPAGKVRRYTSILNFIDVFATAIGLVRSTFLLFKLYPDVVFSTGGYAAFPTLFAARILAIPVVIYDADATPGKVSMWASKFAQWIAVAHPDAAILFPSKVLHKIARTGHPIRKEILVVAKDGGHEFLKLDRTVPTIFVMGGSQGARAINETVLDALASLVERYNVIHQTGTANLAEVTGIASVVLKNSPYESRYRAFGLLNTLALRMAAGITSIVVARAGSGTIFELAAWGMPSILVPLPIDVSHDQTENAFSYARNGAGVVIEQSNFTPHVLVAEVNRLMDNVALREKMKETALTYARPDASRKIAEILLEIAVSHEAA